MAFQKLSVDDVNFENKTVLMRVDFNVPLDDEQNITDDFRIKSALPTIKKVLNDGGKLVLCSHLGRPKGERKPELSLAPVAKRLEELLNQKVQFANDCIGNDVLNAKKNLAAGEVLLLENLRYYKEETKNDPDFAKQLAEGCDIYVNDAFGTAHRAHASTEGVTHYFDKKVAGYLMKKELDYLSKATTNPEKPYFAILGGAKISGKIDVIQNLMDKVDGIVIGGAMVFTFLKSMGKETGTSLVEDDRLDMAKEILNTAEKKGVKLILPVDVLVADKFEANAKVDTVSVDNIPGDMMGVDIGPKSLELIKNELKNAKTVVWNGPMGAFEIEPFSKGTYGLAEFLVELTASGAVTIVGGGDSAAAVNEKGLNSKLSHVSTGGGASLEFLEGKILPGVAALSDK
ncbi:MAG: phosphoglycerate kinase [Calditrichia bacterium]